MLAQSPCLPLGGREAELLDETNSYFTARRNVCGERIREPIFTRAGEEG